MNLKNIVGLIECGETQDGTFKSRGTAFLISPKIAITAYHVIRDGQSEDVTISFTSINQMDKKGKVLAYSHEDAKIDITIIKLEEEINNIELLGIKEGELYAHEKWETYGYPKSIGNSHGTTICGTISQHKSPDAYHNTCETYWEIELLVDSSSSLNDYQGLSGAPLIVDNSIVGVIIIQNDKRLKAISLSNTKEMLTSRGISMEQRPFPLVNLPDYTKYVGIQTAQTFWQSWATGESYSLSPSLFLQGRLEIYNVIKASLETPAPKIIRIQAASREEIIAFTIASIMSFDRTLLAKCFIVESQDALQALGESPIPLIIIPKMENNRGLQVVKNKGHHIILPVEYEDDGYNDSNLILPKLDREGFIREMINIGFNQEQAENISLETSRNIMVLRRRFQIETSSPAWAKKETAREIIPALLMARWNDEHSGDKEKIAFLANKPYEEYIKSLSKWLNQPDTPIYKIGNKWRLAAPLDALYYLAKYITKEDILNLGKTYLEVLQEIHPAMELKPEKRYLANIYGKVAHYSDWAKKGLCHSLILVAVYGEKYQLNTPKQAENWVDEIITSIFTNADVNEWSSLSSYLPFISEAAPNSFLTILEDYLANNSDVIMGLFREYNGMITPVTYHSNLLWSLENLAWFPAYIKRVTIILAKLAELDPGGKLANRPINSLRNIFLPWQSQTYTNFGDRCQVIERIVKKTPNITWQLLLQIMPDSHQWISPSHKTRWRLYNEDALGNITYQELYDNHSFIVEKLIELAQNNESRITQLLESVIHGCLRLRAKDWESVIQHIKMNTPYIAQNSSEYVLWNKIRHILHYHRTYHDTNWALDSNKLNELEAIYLQLEPNDIFAKSKWIFENDWIELLEGRKEWKNDREEYQNKCMVLQFNTLNTIYKQKTFEDILNFGQVYERSYAFIYNLAQIVDKEKEQEIHTVLELIKSREIKKQNFAKNFFLMKAVSHGLTWVTDLYHQYLKNNYSEEQIISFFSVLRVKRDEWKNLWGFIATISDNASVLYWKSVSNIYFGGLEKEDKIFAFLELQKVGRHNFVLYEAHLYGEDLPTELLISSLEKAGYNEDVNNPYYDQYAPRRIFEILHQRGDVDEQRIILQEWKYLQNLVSVYSSYIPLKIHKALAKDASLFLSFLTIIYKSDNKDLQPYTKSICILENNGNSHFLKILNLVAFSKSVIFRFYKNLTRILINVYTYIKQFIINILRFFCKKQIHLNNYLSTTVNKKDTNIDVNTTEALWKQAHTLFQSWKNVPGADGNNNIDENKLGEWINSVRSLAEKDGRLIGADIEIGRILAQYPEQTEDYPPNAICEIIEEINSETINRNYQTALFNKRGFSSRSPFEGGNRERSLVEYFEKLAKNKEILYPKVAEIFRNLAKGYMQDAKREDENAEETNLEY